MSEQRTGPPDVAKEPERSGPAGAGRRTAAFVRIAEWGLYFGLAVWLTWPLFPAAARCVPQGTEPVASVPLLNAWTVWWNADRAAHGLRGYWDAPIFHPTPRAFVFSEAQPTTLLVAPLLVAPLLVAPLAGPDRIALAYNVYLFAVLVLNGAVTARLLRRVGLASVPAVLGGAAVEAAPIVHWQLGVLQLTTVCGVLWVIDAVVAARDRPGVRAGLTLGVAAAVCYAACNYFGLFLSAVLPFAAPFLAGRRLLDWRFYATAAGAAAVAGLLVSPILFAQWEAKSAHKWSRTEDLIIQLSAKPAEYVVNPWPAFGRYGVDPAAVWKLGAGPLKLGLAAVGIVAGLATRGRRRWTLFLVALAGVSFLFSLGPAFEIRGVCPYKLIAKVHPALGLARSPFRFAFFVQLAELLLAAAALDAAWSLGRRAGGKFPSPVARRLAIAAVSCATLALGIAAVVEVSPARQPLIALPTREPNRLWLTWLTWQTAATRPIVCLPFPSGRTAGDYEPTARAMVLQAFHGRPLVEGYSGFFPDDFVRLKEGPMRAFPQRVAIDALRLAGVRHVVALTREAAARAQWSPDLARVFDDYAAGVTVFEILPPDQARPTIDPSAFPAF